MLAAVISEPGHIEIQEVPDPTPGPGEALVEVAACGICGTDQHILLGTYHARYPAIAGHEMSGIVRAVGAGVTAIAPGRRIALNPNLPCRACRLCRRGLPHLCENAEAVGVTMPGGFAELCVVPAELCCPIPDSLSLREAALMEPLSCCLHGLEVLGPQPGDRVAIVGGGTIGLLMTQLVRLHGAARIVVSEPDPGKRELAERLGADVTVDPQQGEACAALIDALDGPADLAVEAVGLGATVALTLDVVGPGGKALLFGVCEDEVEVPLRPRRIFRDEITVAGAYTGPFMDERAIALLTGRRIDASAIISDEFPLTQAAAAMARARAADSLKVLLRPNG